MQLRKGSAVLPYSSRRASEALSQWFPTPRLLIPRSAGVDISDTTIKWVVLDQHSEGLRVRTWGMEPLATGIVVDGLIQNQTALAEALQRVRNRLDGVCCAHAALPEEAAFVFSMHVPPETERKDILNMIEFELDTRVPIPPNAAVYDFDVISEHEDTTGNEIGVVVFPLELAKSYADAFETAGIELLSLEVEARSIARAVTAHEAKGPIILSVDFGGSRTGFAVLKKGIPIFTSTVAVGGDAMNHAIIEKLGLAPEEVTAFKNERGLLAEGGSKSMEIESIMGTAAALADEVAKHYHYWDTRRNDEGERVTPVGQVYLVGGTANLKGLADYIALRVQAPTERPNVWRNVCDFEKYIPPIDRRTSLQFATAIGLALRGV